MKKFTRVSYRAYQEEPFAPDGVGYVEERYLRDAHDERFMYYDRDDQPKARSGHTFVYGDSIYRGSGYAIIKTRHIFTEVRECDALEGGYGMPHPTGGLTSCDGYDIDGRIDGDDGAEVIHLKRYFF